MAKMKITSATMIGGAAAGVGEVVNIDDKLAKDLMRRGRAVPAGEQTKETGGGKKTEGDENSKLGGKVE